MNVPMRVTITVDTAVELNTLVDEMIKLHRAELGKAQRVAMMTGTDAALAALRKIEERAKYITPQHVLRACLDTDRLRRPAAEMLCAVAQDSIVVGRPRGVRQVA